MKRALMMSLVMSLVPLLAESGVTYDVSVRPVDQTDLRLVAVAPVPVVTHYSVDAGKVRVGGPDDKLAYVFRDHLMYVIDQGAKSVHVLRHSTLNDVLAHYAETVRQLDEAAAAAPPELRTQAEQKASDMRTVSERVRQPMPRDFRLTVRFESVDGHACRIWEESESGTKRLELCVAPVASVPGGAEILSAMKLLSEYRQGGNFALGVDFGLASWWPDIAGLGGVPLLIREYKYNSVIRETMVSGMHTAVSGAALWALPEGYPVQEGPEYVQWFQR